MQIMKLAFVHISLSAYHLSLGVTCSFSIYNIHVCIYVYIYYILHTYSDTQIPEFPLAQDCLSGLSAEMRTSFLVIEFLSVLSTQKMI